MSAMKIAFCFAVVIGFVYADLTSRPIKKASFLAAPHAPRGTRPQLLGAAYGASYGVEVRVVDTNLSQEDADLVARIVQDVFDRVTGPEEQADAIQSRLDRLWPRTKNSVVIDYSAVAVHQRYYVILSVNEEHNVFVYGL